MAEPHSKHAGTKTLKGTTTAMEHQEKRTKEHLWEQEIRTTRNKRKSNCGSRRQENQSKPETPNKRTFLHSLARVDFCAPQIRNAANQIHTLTLKPPHDRQHRRRVTAERSAFLSSLSLSLTLSPLTWVSDQRIQSPKL